MQDKTNREYF